MKTLKFHGYSDDTFGEYGVTNEDADNGGSLTPITFEVSAEGKSVLVTGQYDRTKTGAWDIGVSMKEEDNFPNWDMTLYFEGYTTVLEMVVPDDFTLKCVEK